MNEEEEDEKRTRGPKKRRHGGQKRKDTVEATSRSKIETKAIGTNSIVPKVWAKDSEHIESVAPD